MGSLSNADTILVEILTPTALPSKKSTITTSFQQIFDISTKAATDKVGPGLALKVYNHVTAHPEQSALFLCWKDMAHHDALGATEGFAEGRKLFGNTVLPNIEGDASAQVCNVTTSQKDVALMDSDAAEGECSHVLPLGTAS
jgi:hypothetical protein